MERIRLANLQEQFGSLRSTSLPQLKQYFRRRITKCLNECKLQAISMSKIGEHPSGNHNKDDATHPNEYEFGWGSDFSDYDDEEEEEAAAAGEVAHKDNAQVNLTHSRSLQTIYPPTNSLDRDWSGSQNDSPPPPLPKHLPPSLSEEYAASRYGKSNIYETMSPDNTTENDYLLPNTTIEEQPNTNKTADESTYEYIQNCESISPSSSGRRSKSKVNSSTNEVPIERPLPPIPTTTHSHLQQHSSWLVPSRDHDSHGPRYSSQEIEIRKQAWFKDVERDEAESLLRRSNFDGSYLVRKSRRAGIYNPYTLSLYLNNCIFHLNIRVCIDGTYALGKEKSNEKHFATVIKLIEHHKCEPIFLTSKGVAAGKVCLSYCPSD